MNKKEIKEHLKFLHNDIVANITSKELKDLIKKETYFAGGCFKSLFLGEKINDYDLYFKNEASVKRFKELKFLGFNTNFEVLLTTNNAITLEFKDKIIQFIIKFHDMPFQMINRFDFLHCQNFYNPTDEYLELKHLAIKNKVLIFNSQSILPISSIKRIAKFAAQGWIIEDKDIVKLAVAVASHKLEDKKVLKEQVAGLNFSQFDERHDPERVTRKVVKKLKGEKDVQF